MGTPAYRGRFAPSPTGPLHFGSLVAALGSWLHARAAGGEWLLRIEDLDPPREVPGSAEQQVETLQAFGLESDGPVWRQSQRGDAYRRALEQLLREGLAFACRCSRRDLEATGGRHLACVADADPARAPAIRLRLPDQALEFSDRIQGPQLQHLRQEVGDVVLLRADGPWAYQLAVVVDDAAQGITDVVRGADLLDSTPRQIWLQRCLGLPTPRYAHLPLALDPTGEKISKSLGGLPVDAADPLPALRAAWRFLGQPGRGRGAGPVAAWLRAAVDDFDPARIPRASRQVVVAGSSGA